MIYYSLCHTLLTSRSVHYLEQVCFMYGLLCYHKVLILSPLMYYVATTLYYTLAVQKCIKMYPNVSSCSYNKGQYSTSESIA